MPFGNDDREYARSAALPDWMKDFANERLEKDGTTIEDIRNLFNTKSEFDSVEARVSEMRDRVGLDVLEKVASGEKDEIPGGFAESQPDEKYDKEQLGKGIGVEMEHTEDWKVSKEIAKDHLEESKDFKSGRGGKYYDKLDKNEKEIEKEVGKMEEKKSSMIIKLISLANELEKDGNIRAAEAIDQRIQLLVKELMPDGTSFRLSKRSKEKGIFEKFPKLETFIKNVCRSRGGHVELPAVQTMIRNERPEDIDVHNKELVDFIQKCLKEYKKEVEDDGDEYAGEFESKIKMEDDDGNKTVFSEPPSVM
jgi:hypothetical protein